MSPTQKVIECGICGHEMVIPPGYENATGHCPICGGVVSASSSPPASRLDKTMRSARPKPKPAYSEQLKQLTGPVLHGLIIGAIGALVGGMIMAVLTILRNRGGERMTFASILASADPGILAGFVMCSSWAVIRRLALSPITGAAVGASVGLIMGLLTHVLESVLVAPSDMPLLGTATIASVGGAVVGYIIGAKVGAPD
jgi:energy-converting hydrogenase Eha subunit A